MAVHPWTTFAPVWYGGWFVNRRVRYDLGNTPALAQRIIDFLIARRLPLLTVAVAIAVLAFLPARRLQFERSIESMFAPGDPLLETYQQLKRTFGGNEVVLAVYTDPELFHADGRGIRRVAEVSRRLGAVEGVAATLSIDQPLGERVAEADDGPARRARNLFEGYTHSADGQVAAVVCLLRPEQEASVSRQETIDRMRQVMQALPEPLAPGMLAGEPVMVTDGFRYVEEDGARLAVTSTLLLGAVIILSFRSLRWVIVPLAVVHLAVLITRAVLAWSGLEMSMVSSMLTAVVTVVGVATMIHVIVRFREARAGGAAPREALSQAGRILAAPVFWSCTTTVAGFSSLMVSNVGAVQDFGLMMAIGTLSVLASVMLLVPGLALWGRFDADPHRAWGEGLLERQLVNLASLVQRRPKTLGLAILVVTAAAAAGNARMEIESDFTKNFRASSPIVRSYEFVETRLGGAGVWDVMAPGPDEPDWEYLSRIRRLEDRLREEVVVRGVDGSSIAGLTKVLSMVDGVLAAAPSDPDGARTAFRRNLMASTAWRHFSEKMPALKTTLRGEDPDHPGRHLLRIMLRSKERQPSATKRAIIEQVERICREEFPPAPGEPGAVVSGFFVLLAHLIESIIRDQWLAFLIATGAIWLMMLAALRQWLLALIALVPNILPIFVVLGMMAWLGLKLNMGAAMIAAVSVGLSIDSSVHYLTSFRRARDQGMTLAEALGAVQQTVGRAVVFSTIALVAGFAVLSTSQFVPTIYFGALVGLSMLGGLAGNLVVLPLLLVLLNRPA
ncbi:MAG: efflux RND transporter permease subunit [Thermoguttaceae bacterium]